LEFVVVLVGLLEDVVMESALLFVFEEGEGWSGGLFE
jgi:hypothetical protein